jgi:hypothetical protein
MKDSQLGEWMRVLPRAKASPAFNSEVLRKARREERRTPFVWRSVVWRTAAVAAMAACIVLLVNVAVIEYAHQKEFMQRRHVAELRSEQEKIQAELEAVKKAARETEPVVVLENDDGTRVEMDVDSAIQPASLRTYD